MKQRRERETHESSECLRVKRRLHTRAQRALRLFNEEPRPRRARTQEDRVGAASAERHARSRDRRGGGGLRVQRERVRLEHLFWGLADFLQGQTGPWLVEGARKKGGGTHFELDEGLGEPLLVARDDGDVRALPREQHGEGEACARRAARDDTMLHEGRTREHIEMNGMGGRARTDEPFRAGSTSCPRRRTRRRRRGRGGRSTRGSSSTRWPTRPERGARTPAP